MFKLITAISMATSLALGVFSFTLNSTLAAANATIGAAQALNKAQKAKITKNAVKRVGRTAAAAAIPIAGVVIVAGLSAEAYCERVQENIELQDVLDGTVTEFSFESCKDQAKSDAVVIAEDAKNEVKDFGRGIFDQITNFFN